MTTLKKATCLTSISIGILWFSIFFSNFLMRTHPGAFADDFFDRQQNIFYLAGYDLFGDYATPRNCAASQNPYVPDPTYSIERKDACYPALALAIVKLFPQDHFIGGLLFSLFSIAIWLLSLMPLFGTSGHKSKMLVLFTIITGEVFIYSSERANLIFIAATAINLFLAWHNSSTPIKRYAAALFLAIATVLKVSPVLLGILYFRNKQWREICLSALIAALLFFCPFVWFGGAEAILTWIENAAQNSQFYSVCGTWGGAPFFVSFRFFRLLPLTGHDHILFVFRLPFILTATAGGVAVLLWAFRRSSMIRVTRHDTQTLLILCLMLLPGNMLEYTGLYLMPFFILWCQTDDQDLDSCMAIGFLLLFFQLQPFSAVCFNHFNLLIHNFGFILIAGCFYATTIKRIRNRQTPIGRQTPST